MARKLTKEAIRKLLSKGLTGWESGKLVLQDFADQSCGKPSFLTSADIEEIKRGLTGDKDIRDYNNLMAMCRGMGRGLMVCDGMRHGLARSLPQYFTFEWDAERCQ